MSIYSKNRPRRSDYKKELAKYQQVLEFVGNQNKELVATNDELSAINKKLVEQNNELSEITTGSIDENFKANMLEVLTDIGFAISDNSGNSDLAIDQILRILERNKNL